MQITTSVYPRWRGEHNRRFKKKPGCGGLSPLARGTHELPELEPPEWRFIPAGAGNTVAFSIQAPEAPVYPRWRGEHSSNSVWIAHNPGLSPLARGTHHANGQLTRHIRFIPAGAGNTPYHDFRREAEAVYPRWRGEHIRLSKWQIWENGLSPLARGTLVPLAFTFLQVRFIPAGAGNTLNGYHCL